MLTVDFSPEEELLKAKIKLKLLQGEIEVHALVEVQGNSVGVDVLELITDSGVLHF